MIAGDAQSLIEEALRHHQQGARAEARMLYQAALAMAPDHAECHYYLGILLYEMAEPAAAIRHLAHATRLRPEQATWVSDLGAICAAAGDRQGAIGAFTRLVGLEPRRADVWGQLGDLHRVAGDSVKARECYARALTLAPAMSAASHNLALLLVDARELDAALATVDAALVHAPDHGPLHLVRGIVLAARNSPQLARESLQHALELDGTLDEARLQFGLTLIELGEPDAAQAALEGIPADSTFRSLALAGLGDLSAGRGKHGEAIRLYEASLARKADQPSVLNNLGMALTRTGESTRAEAVLSRALALSPDSADILSNLANAQLALGDSVAAEATLRRAVSLAPEDARYAANLGNVLWVAGRLADAEAQCRHAVAQDPLLGAGWGNLGTVLRDQARFEAAVTSYRKAVELEPASPVHLSNLLYALCYVSDVTPEQLLAEHREYSRRFEAPLVPSIKSHANSKVPERKLRIGYVSADFKNHPVAQFILPILKAHDRINFEVFAYSSTPRYDDVTRECRAATDHWVDCAGLDDDEMAGRIRADAVDVLVDLSGHTAGNRLPVFCRRPAPVQLAYLGYPATTGLDAIGYRFSDAIIDPIDSDICYSERLVRLERGLYALPVAEDWPDPGPSPCRQNGFITFASFNNANKLDSRCLALWQQILLRHPGARMLFLAVPEGPVRDGIIAGFDSAGVAPERLRFEGRLARKQFLSAMASADIALDSFPMTGGTTTIESLCMGIPVVSLMGNRYASRVSASFLASAGLDQLIAQDADAYRRIVDELVAQPEGIAAMRSSLRSRVRSSPLADVEGLVRRIESAFRSLWRQWCEQPDR